MKIIGHRGARGLSPENTLASFKKAIQHGVDEIELDVRVTSDGVAVLHHDPAITDPDGTELPIAHTTYAELLRHKPDLAALDHAIRTIAHRCTILIEIKPGVPVKPVFAILHDRLQRGWRVKEFSIASFDFSILRAFQDEFPLLTLVVNEKWSGVRASSRARRLHTHRVSMNQRWLWRGFVAAMKRQGFQLSPYTINTLAQARRWHPYLYGIITDRPDLFEKRS